MDLRHRRVARDSNAGFEDVPRSNGDSRVGGGGVVRARAAAVSVARIDRSIARRRALVDASVERVVGHALAANRRPGVWALAAIRIHRIGGVRREDFDRRGNAKRRASDFDRRGDLRGAVQETRRGRDVFPAAAGGSNRAATNLPSLDVRNAPIGRNPAPYCNPYSPNARYAASRLGTRARARKRSEDAPNSAPGSPNERPRRHRRRDAATTRGRASRCAASTLAVDVRRGNQSDAFVTDVESTDANDDPRSIERRERSGASGRRTRSSTPLPAGAATPFARRVAARVASSATRSIPAAGKMARPATRWSMNPDPGAARRLRRRRFERRVAEPQRRARRARAPPAPRRGGAAHADVRHARIEPRSPRRVPSKPPLPCGTTRTCALVPWNAVFIFALPTRTREGLRPRRTPSGAAATCGGRSKDRPFRWKTEFPGGGAHRRETRPRRAAGPRASGLVELVGVDGAANTSGVHLLLVSCVEEAGRANRGGGPPSGVRRAVRLKDRPTCARPIDRARNRGARPRSAGTAPRRRTSSGAWFARAGRGRARARAGMPGPRRLVPRRGRLSSGRHACRSNGAVGAAIEGLEVPEGARRLGVPAAPPAPRGRDARPAPRRPPPGSNPRAPASPRPTDERARQRVSNATEGPRRSKRKDARTGLALGSRRLPPRATTISVGGGRADGSHEIVVSHSRYPRRPPSTPREGSRGLARRASATTASRRSLCWHMPSSTPCWETFSGEPSSNTSGASNECGERGRTLRRFAVSRSPRPNVRTRARRSRVGPSRSPRAAPPTCPRRHGAGLKRRARWTRASRLVDARFRRQNGRHVAREGRSPSWGNRKARWLGVERRRVRTRRRARPPLEGS